MPRHFTAAFLLLVLLGLIGCGQNEPAGRQQARKPAKASKQDKTSPETSPPAVAESAAEPTEKPAAEASPSSSPSEENTAPSSPAETAVSEQPTPENGSAPPASETPAGGTPAERSGPTAATAHRVLLMTPAGPILIGMEILVDGRSHEEVFAEFLEMFRKAADLDENGEVRWEELVESPRVIYGQFGGRPLTDEAARAEVMQLYDINRNGRVEDDEAIRFVTSNSSGSRPFALQGGGTAIMPQNLESPLSRLLDADWNNQLTRDELAQAAERIRLADQDDDWILQRGEMRAAVESATEMDLPGRAMTVGRRDVEEAAVLLEERLPWESLSYQLQERYGIGGTLDATTYPVLRALMELADQNLDLWLDEKELKQLLEIKPQLELQVHLGGGENSPKQLQILHLAESLNATVIEQPDRLWIQLPGVSLEITALDQVAQVDYQSQAEAQFERLDADQNGYLDEDETTAGPFVGQFAAVDVDADQQIVLDELVGYLQQQQAVARALVRGRAGDHPDPLQAILDEDLDGRLQAREIQQAADRLLAADKDGNGRLEEAEVPRSVSFVIARGNPLLGDNLFLENRVATVNRRDDWFDWMDYNGDGEIGPREFLGTVEQFETLDANRDGFIERAEAIPKPDAELQPQTAASADATP